MGLFSGIVACVSGKFSVSQKEMQNMLEENGAKIVGSVTKACNLLVCSEEGTSKYETAVKNGINIVKEDWVTGSIEAGEQQTDADLFFSQASGGLSSSSSAKSSKASAAAAKPKSTRGKKKKEESEDDEEEEASEEEEPEAKEEKKKAAPKKKKASAGGVFDGIVACVSGKFSVSQKELQTLLEENGAKIVGSVTKACNLLVASEVGTGKFTTAESAGIRIVTEDWVNQSIEEGEQSTDANLFLSQPDSSSSSKATKASKDSKETKASGRGRKRKAEEEEEENEDEDEEEEKPKAKKASKAKASGGSVFSGYNVCVSGKFSISQGDMKKLLETNGAKIVSTVTSACNLLVASEEGTSKFNTAKGKDISIVTEDFVNHCIEQGSIDFGAPEEMFLYRSSDAQPSKKRKTE